MCKIREVDACIVAGVLAGNNLVIVEIDEQALLNTKCMLRSPKNKEFA
jgi:hypothetical protein